MVNKVVADLQIYLEPKLQDYCQLPLTIKFYNVGQQLYDIFM